MKLFRVPAVVDATRNCRQQKHIAQYHGTAKEHFEKVEKSYKTRDKSMFRIIRSRSCEVFFFFFFFSVFFFGCPFQPSSGEGGTKGRAGRKARSLVELGKAANDDLRSLLTFGARWALREQLRRRSSFAPREAHKKVALKSGRAAAKAGKLSSSKSSVSQFIERESWERMPEIGVFLK